MESKLSQGIIPQLFTGQVEPGSRPIMLQILNMKKVSSGVTRLNVSDGQYQSQVSFICRFNKTLRF